MSSYSHYSWAINRQVGDPLAKALLILISLDTNPIGYRMTAYERAPMKDEVGCYFRMLEVSDEEGTRLIYKLLAGGHLIDSFGLVPAFPEEIPTPRQRPMDAKRRRVFERDGWKCVYCGCTESLTIDHKHPKSRGGTNRDDNLATACRSCNSKKGARTVAEWIGDVL